MKNMTELLQKSGMSEKESKVYLACLELGEATVKEISRKSGVVRTSLYYMIERLAREGFITETKRGKKNYLTACTPTDLAQKLRYRLREFESHLGELEALKGNLFKKPRMYFLHGQNGFKEAWNIIFKSDPREYSIITEGLNFLDYVKAKYIVSEIISKKKKLGVKSSQIIVDSEYARNNILPKDKLENRKSRLLPFGTRLSFTEVICPNLVAYISPKYSDSIFIIEDAAFAETRKVLFDQMWYTLPQA